MAATQCCLRDLHLDELAVPIGQAEARLWWLHWLRCVAMIFYGKPRPGKLFSLSLAGAHVCRASAQLAVAAQCR